MNPQTTPDLVTRNAEREGDMPFLLFEEETLTYADLRDRTESVAHALAERGVGRGDIVAYLLGNSPAVFDVLLGAQRLAAVGAPVSCWWQPPEVQYLLNDCRAKVLVVDPEFVPLARAILDATPSVKHVVVNAPAPVDLGRPHDLLPRLLETPRPARLEAVPPAPEDAAAVMYTSGTTGKPKGVLLSHRGILEGARLKTERIPLAPGERALCVLPLFHSGGLNDLAFPTMACGATIVLRRAFSASEFWGCVERYRVSAFYIVPTMWNILLRTAEADRIDTRSLRFGVSGAAPIPPEQLDECRRRFGIPIVEGYGMTETSGGVTANTLERSKAGSVGIPFDGIEVRTVDADGKPLAAGEVGEIVVRGPVLMQGYLGRPEATAETIVDGWLHTGDMGSFDEDGFLFLADRKKDLIIRGGVNVYPKEIENVIAEHLRVAAVAVVAEPHDKYGQVAKACVVPRRGAEIDEADLRRHCEERLAGYKVPASFVLRPSLPRNAVGKVLKQQLLRELDEEASAEPVPVAPLFEGLAKRFLPEKARGIDATVTYQITGGGGGVWTVRVRDGSLEVTRGLLADSTVHVVASDRTYHAVATGRLDPVTAVVTGKLSMEGDVGFMARFRELFRPLGS